MENLMVENINSQIYTIRGESVMIDSDLAKLYQVETKNLNKAVSRNLKRFPNDFMFQLTKEEFENQRFQFGTFNLNLKNRKYEPYVFTEHGIAMLSSVLRSDIAIEVNIQIMRTFTALRRYALTYEDLAKKINEIESRVSKGEQTDQKIIEVLNQLMAKDDTTIGKIGFVK